MAQSLRTIEQLDWLHLLSLNGPAPRSHFTCCGLTVTNDRCQISTISSQTIIESALVRICRLITAPTISISDVSTQLTALGRAALCNRREHQAQSAELTEKWLGIILQWRETQGVNDEDLTEFSARYRSDRRSVREFEERSYYHYRRRWQPRVYRRRWRHQNYRYDPDIFESAIHCRADSHQTAGTTIGIQNHFTVRNPFEFPAHLADASQLESRTQAATYSHGELPDDSARSNIILNAFALEESQRNFMRTVHNLFRTASEQSRSLTSVESIGTPIASTELTSNAGVTGLQPEHPAESRDCTICLDTLNKPVCLSPCGHKFCEECISGWTISCLEQQEEHDSDDEEEAVAPRCPLCRAPYDDAAEVA